MSLAGPGEWEAAITAAERAAVALRKMSSQERRQMLTALAAGVKARQEELAQTIVAEGGKPITYARAEMSRGVMTLSLAAEEAARLGGEVLPLDLTRAGAGRWGITRRFPVGPVLGITPFNFPFNLVAHKVGPALAAGNPIIIKPSSACPLTALKLAEVWDQAGLPAGGLQVLPCAARLAEAAVADDRLKVLSFTGSAVVGWDLKSKAGKKRVILELGGNAACIVDAGADLTGGGVPGRHRFLRPRRPGLHRGAAPPGAPGDLCVLQSDLSSRPFDAGNRRRGPGPGRDGHRPLDRCPGRGRGSGEWVREAKSGGAPLAAGNPGAGNLMPATVLPG